MSNRLATILSAIGLYLISTGVSYAGFSYFGGGARVVEPATQEETEESRLRVDLSLPKTAECPLNGKMYTEAEKEIWSKWRPLGVMIENHVEARPQAGLSRADVIYEAIAEGGITRFLSVFLCGAAAEDVRVAPVRSARIYFVEWITEYGDYPLYVHVGGAHCNAETGSGCQNGAKADALGLIRKNGWNLYNDINQMAGLDVGYPNFVRDEFRLGHQVATEHSMTSSTDKLYAIAAGRGLGYTDEEGNAWDEEYVPWEFKDDAEEKGEVNNIEFLFWDGYDAYGVKWAYDPENNIYKRFNDGQEHKDINWDEQLSGKVIVVAMMDESRANDGYDNNLHLLYDNKGTGKAYVFQDGEVIEGTWNKKTRTDRTVFLDKAGKQIEFNRGQIWVEILPTGQSVNY